MVQGVGVEPTQPKAGDLQSLGLTYAHLPLHDLRYVYTAVKEKGPRTSYSPGA